MSKVFLTLVAVLLLCALVYITQKVAVDQYKKLLKRQSKKKK